VVIAVSVHSWKRQVCLIKVDKSIIREPHSANRRRGTVVKSISVDAWKGQDWVVKVD